MSLSDILSGAASVADYPGSMLRGALAGKPGHRKSGREMLESWGALGPNQEGFDAGDVPGFLADVVVDPVNIVGGALATKGVKALSAAMKARKASKAGSVVADSMRPLAAAVAGTAPLAEKVAPAVAATAPARLAEAVGIQGVPKQLAPKSFTPLAPAPAKEFAAPTFTEFPLQDGPKFTRAVEDNGIFHNLTHQGQPVGSLELRHDKVFDQGTKRLFPGVVKPDDKVVRLQGIGLDQAAGTPFRDKGVGREMWRRAFGETGDGWLGNSQLGFEDDLSAVRSLQKLEQNGWVNVHWKRGPGSNFVARLTDDGKKWVAGEIPSETSKTYARITLVQSDYGKGSSKIFRNLKSPDDLFERIAKDPSDTPYFPTSFKIGNTNYELPAKEFDDIYAKYMDRSAKESIWRRGGKFVGETERRKIVDEELLPLIKKSMVAVPEAQSLKSAVM